MVGNVDAIGLTDRLADATNQRGAPEWVGIVPHE